MLNVVHEHVDVVLEFFSDEVMQQIKDFSVRCIDAINNGNKIFVCGNGGSAADAQHFAAELVGTFERSRRPLPAIALTTDTSIITATANDYSYNQIFTKQLRALANKGDILIGISTSGQSQNVLDALHWGENKGMECMMLTGKKGAPYMGDKIVVPSLITARIQECHIIVLHLLAGLIEEAFVPLKWG